MVVAILLLVMLVPVMAQPNRENALAIMQQYAPEEYEILKRYKSLPNNLVRKTKNGGTMTSTAGDDVLMFIDFESEAAMLGSMSTNTHELNHMLTSGWFWEWARVNNVATGTNLTYYFYIKPGTEFPVDTDLKFFPSAVLTKVIPQKQITYRFETYINGTSSTQAHGLLGLLGEYNSYFHGLKTSMQLRPAFLNAGKEKPAKNYTNWLMDAGGSSEAYYEFRFFIFEYLLYARTHYPDLYKSLKTEGWFAAVFNAISEEYYSYLKSWQYEVTEGYMRFAEKNKIESLSTPGVRILFGGAGSFSGLVVRTEDYYKLFDVLHSTRYDVLFSELGLKPFREPCFGK